MVFCSIPLRVHGKVVVLQCRSERECLSGKRRQRVQSCRLTRKMNQSYVFPSSRVIAGYDWFFLFCVSILFTQYCTCFLLRVCISFTGLGARAMADMGEGRLLCAAGPWCRPWFFRPFSSRRKGKSTSGLGVPKWNKSQFLVGQMFFFVPSPLHIHGKVVILQPVGRGNGMKNELIIKT